MSIKPIDQTASQFYTNFQAYSNLETLNTDKLEGSAQDLQNSVVDFRDNMYKKATSPYERCPRDQLQDILRQEKVPLALALRLTEALASNEMQFDYSFKQIVAKTTLIIWELIVFKAKASNEHIYPETRDSVRESLEKVKKTLPKREIETRFYVNCLLALIQKIQPGKGKFTEVLDRHSVNLIKGTLSTACSASPAGVNPGPLIGAIVDLAVDIYHEFEHRWYQDIWGMSWIDSGKRVTTVDRFKDLNVFIKGFEDDNKKTFYLAQMYFEMISSDQTEQELKSYVFNQAKPNLIDLASRSNESKVPILQIEWKKDNFWKVRCVVVKYLSELALHEDFQEESMKTLVDRYIEEEHPVTGSVLFRSFTDFISDKATEPRIRQALKDINLEEKIKVIESRMDKLPQKIDRAKKEKEKEVLKFKLQRYTEQVNALEELKKIKGGMQLQSDFSTKRIKRLIGQALGQISSKDQETPKEDLILNENKSVQDWDEALKQPNGMERLMQLKSNVLKQKEQKEQEIDALEKDIFIADVVENKKNRMEYLKSVSNPSGSSSSSMSVAQASMPVSPSIDDLISELLSVYIDGDAKNSTAKSLFELAEQKDLLFTEEQFKQLGSYFKKPKADNSTRNSVVAILCEVTKHDRALPREAIEGLTFCLEDAKANELAKQGASNTLKEISTRQLLHFEIAKQALKNYGPDKEEGK